jgi:hypothetical protein
MTRLYQTACKLSVWKLLKSHQIRVLANHNGLESWFRSFPESFGTGHLFLGNSQIVSR